MAPKKKEIAFLPMKNKPRGLLNADQKKKEKNKEIIIHSVTNQIIFKWPF